MTRKNMNEKIKVGDYLIIGVVGDYKVMEQFGGYRMLKKTFKTVKQATQAIERMQIIKKAYTS